MKVRSMILMKIENKSIKVRRKEILQLGEEQRLLDCSYFETQEISCIDIFSYRFVVVPRR